MEENPEAEFQNLFVTKIKERGLTLAKLSELSGIAMKHLQNLNAGRLDSLPAAPYLRGYLVKLGHILDFDGEAWLEKFRAHGLIRGSGPNDELPKNRFAREPLNKKIIGGIVLLIVLLYAGFRFSKILGRPTIEITYPENDLLIVQSKDFLVQGKAQDANELYISVGGGGDELIPIGESGLWQKTILLGPGDNTIRVRAKKFLGRETEVVRHIIFEEPVSDIFAPHSSAPIPGPILIPSPTSTTGQ